MTIPQNKHEKRCTYRDYLTWDNGHNWEVVDGVAYMQAAPSWEHQRISMGVCSQFYVFLSGKPCQVYAAPFDVRIPDGDKADEDSETVVQPDISIICDKTRLKGTGYFGVPTLIVEILSPGTAAYDKKIKRKKYESAGVRELWMIDPGNRMVDVFRLNGSNHYDQPESYSAEDTITGDLFPGLDVDLRLVFDYA